jgi:hypothetical protein
MAFEKISRIIGRVSNKNAGMMNAAKICYFAQQILADRIPQTDKNLTFWNIISFKNQTITVGVANAVIANEIINNKQDLIEKFNRRIGENKVQNIKTIIQ